MYYIYMDYVGGGGSWGKGERKGGEQKRGNETFLKICLLSGINVDKGVQLIDQGPLKRRYIFCILDFPKGENILIMNLKKYKK